MFKFKLLLILITILNVSFSQDKEFIEQVEKREISLTISIGLPYSFHLKALGVNSRIYLNIGENICFGPEFSYFKKDETSILEFNFVGHYILEIGKIGVYPLGGFNYTIEQEPFHKQEGIGIVFGAGIHKGFNKLMVFGEFSHIESKLKDDFITFGLMYHF